MVQDIRHEFDTILKEIDWMDEDTRSKAKKKADGIVEHIGYPSELLDVRKLEDLYVGLELNSTHYLGNALNITFFATSYAFSKLRERVNKTIIDIYLCTSIYSVYTFIIRCINILSIRSTRPTGFVMDDLQLLTRFTVPLKILYNFLLASYKEYSLRVIDHGT